MTADPELPIPPKCYGGIERVLDMLIQGLVKRGHAVTLFANSQSQVPCEFVPYPGKSSMSRQDTFKNMRTVAQKVSNGGYDLVNSHGRLAYLLPLLFRKIPKIMTYHRKISARSVILGNWLSRGSLHFTGVSKHLIHPVEKYAKWHVTYDGAFMEKYVFSGHVEKDAPLVFLGRIEYIKGTHLAIEVAKKSGRRLVIAGNVEAEHKHYFDEKIAPCLDGINVQYLGPVNDIQKNELLGQAKAFLMPILWDEPFGIVMAEALACGTPVIGLKRGSVPEVVQDGQTGFVCDSVAEMAAAVNKVERIDRKVCRKIVEERFSDEAVINQYEAVYKEVVGGKGI